jgi:hypothetical protein
MLWHYFFNLYLTVLVGYIIINEIDNEYQFHMLNIIISKAHIFNVAKKILTTKS